MFQVVENPDNPLRFDVYEEFTNRDTFEHHQLRVKDSDWGRVTVNVERHYEILNVQNNEASHSVSKLTQIVFFAQLATLR